MFPNGHSSLQDENDESKARVDLQVPSCKTILSFRRLDVITVRLSCDLSNVVARIPPPNIHLVTMRASPRLSSADRSSAQPKVQTSHIHDLRGGQTQSDASAYSNEENKHMSIFSVLSSMPANSTLHNVSFRCDTDKSRRKVKERLQTIKGRIYMNGFNANKLDPESMDSDTNKYNSKASLAEQAATGDYNASKQIEREATARMQRIAAERRNTKRKATKRK